MPKDGLTDVAVKQAPPKDKDYWLSDGGGLRLLVKSNGTKCWRFNYRFGKKQKTLALGVYPDVSLKEARALHREAKSKLDQFIDPAESKKQQKRQHHINTAHLFENVARDWWDHHKDTWTEDHANRIWTRLEADALPYIGRKSIHEIFPQDVIEIVRRIERRNALDVAERVKNDIDRVCRYGVQNGLLRVSPTAELRGINKTRKRSHRDSLPREQLPAFLRELDRYHERGRLLTKLALQLLILTFVRPGELRGARWEEFDLEDKIWRIPGHRMKMGTDHLVPLSPQALEIIDQVRPISGRYEFLFPSERSRRDCMSDNTMRLAMCRMGYDGTVTGKSKATPHGFRATASSILNETGFNPDAIERQLSHMERNGVRAAYTHHARYLEERRRMMIWWADYLESMKNSGKVVPIFANKESAGNG